MAISRLTSIVTSVVVRQRLPLIGAFCILSFGFHPLSRYYFPQFLSKTKGFCTTSSGIKMESSSTVPSIVVYVTVPNKDAGVESVYLWQGEIQTDSEELLIIKTRESLLDALTEHVKANHEYDVPEVIATSITGGSIPYLEWLKNSTRE